MVESSKYIFDANSKWKNHLQKEFRLSKFWKFSIFNEIYILYECARVFEWYMFTTNKYIQDV
ncbi:MAG: hypothetical protein EBS53_13420 [Bacteroidetes bacterium]|nr:hypothetical protein [Bacteroidota bacterium]